MSVKIYTPANMYFCGVRNGIQFKNGVAEVDDDKTAKAMCDIYPGCSLTPDGKPKQTKKK